MNEVDAASMAEMPESHRKVVAGSHEDTERVRQTFVAGKEETSSKTLKLIEQVVGRENLKQALKRVRANKGSPGIDGMTVDELVPYLKAHWPRLREELLSAAYKPQPVLGVDIPKASGGTRRLGIPTVVDRFIQQAILQVLTPIFDTTFSEASYGYRPGRSAQQAVEAGRKYVAAGYRWVVDMDIEKFFDRVNHDVLMSRVARRVEDKRLLKLLRAYLNAGMMVDGVAQSHEEGTPQGGPLSPLMSNILLDELDKELERRGHKHVRYADDSNVYVRSWKAGRRVMASLEQFLAERLRLKVNREKSLVGRPWKRSFLGYLTTMEMKTRLKVSAESVKRAHGDLKARFRRGRGCSLAKITQEVNLFIRGWAGYYRLAQVQKTFEEMDEWIRRRMRWVLWRQWKRPRTRLKKMMQLGLNKQRACESAWNGRGPWWNSGASHMNASITTQWLSQQGLLSLLGEQRRLASSL
jgi:RNA-directed DNA polymerase